MHTAPGTAGARQRCWSARSSGALRSPAAAAFVQQQRRTLVAHYGAEEDRWTLSQTMRTMQLEEEESSIKNLGVDTLRHRLSLLGESTLGINSAAALRRLLAHRLHKAKAQATRFPLRRTEKGARGTKAYLLVPVDVEEVGITDFLIDTGTTGTLITSSMRDQIGLSPVAGHAVKGLDNLGVTLRQKVALPQLRLGPFHLDIPDGFVTEVRVEKGDNIGGVLGLRFLTSYEVELNPEHGHVAFHPLGHVRQGVVSTHKCSRLACQTTKGGLLAVQVSLNGCQPFPGILDLGATFSTINTAAARAAELSGGAPLNLGRIMSGDGSLNPVVRDGMRICLGTPTAPSKRQPSATQYSNPTAQQQQPSQQHGGSVKEDEEEEEPGRRWPVVEDVYCPAHELLPILVRDVPVLNVLGFKGQPAMVLGQDLIGRTRTVFCLDDNAIYLQH